MRRHAGVTLILAMAVTIATGLATVEAVEVERVRLKDGRTVEGQLAPAERLDYFDIALFHKGKAMGAIRVHRDDIVSRVKTTQEDPAAPMPAGTPPSVAAKGGEAAPVEPPSVPHAPAPVDPLVAKLADIDARRLQLERQRDDIDSRIQMTLIETREVKARMMERAVAYALALPPARLQPISDQDLAPIILGASPRQIADISTARDRANVALARLTSAISSHHMEAAGGQPRARFDPRTSIATAMEELVPHAEILHRTRGLTLPAMPDRGNGER